MDKDKKPGEVPIIIVRRETPTRRVVEMVDSTAKPIETVETADPPKAQKTDLERIRDERNALLGKVASLRASHDQAQIDLERIREERNQALGEIASLQGKLEATAAFMEAHKDCERLLRDAHKAMERASAEVTRYKRERDEARRGNKPGSGKRWGIFSR